MSGKPVKPGNWGTWAVIHSESADQSHRQNGEYTEPMATIIDHLSGEECKHANNVSNQLVLCRNNCSGYIGKKCPGQCPLYDPDWKKVNAHIIDKPRYDCLYCQKCGASCVCTYIHMKTVACKACKNYKERLRPIKRKSPEQKKIEQGKKHEATLKFFSENAFYVKQQKTCLSDGSKLINICQKVRMKHGKYKPITFGVCPTCCKRYIT